MKENINVKKITLLGIGIALYVVLSFAIKIPLISHIQTDLGYIAFGAMCAIAGVPALIVGVFGCLLESLFMTGWVPIGWMIGQGIIGIICGYAYKKNKNIWLNIIITIVAILIGIGGIKTIIECYLYAIPFAVKIPKNLIASVADMVPMIGGYLLAIKTPIKRYITK